MSSLNIGVIVGSLAKGSINRQLAEALKKLAPEGVEFSDISIDLPIYSYDYDADYPPQGVALKAAIERADAILIVTPEYNRSIPGGLKNALDWASRPWGKNSFNAKPVAVMGTSPGAIGTAVGQAALRNVLAFLNVAQMNQPEVYLQFKPDMLDASGAFANPDTEKFLRGVMDSFVKFASQHKG